MVHVDPYRRPHNQASQNFQDKQWSGSVVLLDVSECLAEEVLVFDLVFDVDDAAEGFLDLVLAGFGVLPAKIDEIFRPVYIGDAALDEYRGSSRYPCMSLISAD